MFWLSLGTKVIYQVKYFLSHVFKRPEKPWQALFLLLESDQ
jgi:hypothetical protein